MSLFNKKKYIYENKLTDMLPVGSIVDLSDNKKIMVIDYGCDMDKDINEKGLYKIKYYYIGCNYPLGHIPDDRGIKFEDNEIKNILFKGYTSNERQEFLNEVMKVGDNTYGK